MAPFIVAEPIRLPVILTAFTVLWHQLEPISITVRSPIWLVIAMVWIAVLVKYLPLERHGDPRVQTRRLVAMAMKLKRDEEKYWMELIALKEKMQASTKKEEGQEKH
jgi:hypothetical protein